ncbi:aspartate kinase [Christiangramia portivictoriae]|uniref:aspartate kinase n=1 Tax=Christiangramia portivictoriae TaxID=326069 RepID=UPI00040A499A|nr:aspartate kinase [Christiangramia portivictoriae]
MKIINLALFGPGKVGSKLIQQIIAEKDQLLNNSELEIRIILIANSSNLITDHLGFDEQWKDRFDKEKRSYHFQDILRYFAKNEFRNLISIDTTASESLPENYIDLIEHGSHIVAANKVANTLSLQFYENLRTALKKHHKIFQYETNVGAGLPVVETIKSLYDSGERVTRIRGVFSGSLSYIFNTYSRQNVQFSEVLRKAGELGYTEPDARVDLSGKDVARKLLILARELQLKKELKEVSIQSLLPTSLNGGTSLQYFQKQISILDDIFQKHKDENKSGEVLRYVGELNVENGSLEARLISANAATPLGQIDGTDNIFEIYSESYKDFPLVIQGAGAGIDVTARGVFSDILKLNKQLN